MLTDVSSIVLRIIGAVLLLIVPVIGWIGSIFLIVTLFTDKKNKEDYYCTECDSLLIRDGVKISEKQQEILLRREESGAVECDSCGKTYKVLNIHHDTMCPFCEYVNKQV
ncbi:MAG: hypothetical protein IJS88_07070 [Alphaproteobacteria bacterium]|nr:hypothetical protein [Alphaproteobacteria bacterium]